MVRLIASAALLFLLLARPVMVTGTPKKQPESLDYQKLCQAALANDSLAAYRLGFWYFRGQNAPRNLNWAMYWFDIASQRGDIYARKMSLRFRHVKRTKDPRCTRPIPKQPETKALELPENPNKRKIYRWVARIAPEFQLDPNLVIEVIAAESGFNISARSPKDAQGLMQLIPETARRFGVKNTFDPLQNIQGGSAYLQWLLQKFDGKLELALAAYNAGEGAVLRHEGIPPYPETQAYVRKILSRYGKSTHPIPASTKIESPIQY